MSDSATCFTFLADNIPSWLEELQRIGKKISEKQDEISKVPVVPKTAKKSGSTESLRPGKESVLEQETGDVAAPAPRNEVPNQAMRQALANRKRKTASVLSRASGPSKYRTRNMIVVYYDSEVQKAFEALVRNIGTGRNMLRKGKMTARVETMTVAPDDDDDDDDDNCDPTLLKLQFRPRAGLAGFRTTRGMGCDGGSEAYDSADKALENAQSLCERGAHQSLRDGDCRAELDGAKRSFQEVVKICEQEVEKQKDKAGKAAEKAAEKARQKDQARQSQISASTVDTDSKLLPASINGATTIDHIEVDDDTSDEEFVMPILPRGLRLTSRV